jgi:hypothetical protein
VETDDKSCEFAEKSVGGERYEEVEVNEDGKWIEFQKL